MPENYHPKIEKINHTNESLLRKSSIVINDWINMNESMRWRSNSFSATSPEFVPQVRLLGEPDAGQSDELQETGICIPTLSCSSRVSRGRTPIPVNVNYLDLADGSSRAELRLPIAYDLTTATEHREPQVKIDRSGPSSKVLLPLGVKFSSASAESQHQANSMFWLGALVANEAADRRPSINFGAIVRQMVKDADVSSKLLFPGLAIFLPDTLMPIDKISNAIGFLAGSMMLSGSGAKYYAFMKYGRLQLKPPSRTILPASQFRNYPEAKLVNDRKLKKQAAQLAKKYPVLEPSI